MAVCAAGWRMSDDTRDLAQRIRDALAGVTPIAFDERAGILGEVDENGVFRVWEQPVFTLTNIALIVAAPSLLRDALARIEADAATIAALREEVRGLYDAAQNLAGGLRDERSDDTRQVRGWFTDDDAR